MSPKKILCVLCLLLVSVQALHALDSDGDGISDDIEQQSLHSSPYHKDIFVEVDFFSVNGTSMRPAPGFLAIVNSVFASAPVSNPDGTTGIRLHVEINQRIPWPKFALGRTNLDGSYDWTEFDQVKARYFSPSHWSTHHYCLFVYGMGDANGNTNGFSGISRNTPSAYRAGASDFIVALGQAAPSDWSYYNPPSPLVWIQAGTFLHELGHNLGLKHGGGDHIGFKPNELSLMSYYYQVDGIPIQDEIDGQPYDLYDYSEVKVGALNENHLCEQCGIGGVGYYADPSGDAWDYGVRWQPGPDRSSVRWVYDATGALNCAANVGCVDWNVDGRFENSSRVNLNLTFGPHLGYAELTNLPGGIKEWPILVYNGGLIGQTAPTAYSLPMNTTMTCLRRTKNPTSTENHAATIVRRGTPATVEDLRRKHHH